MMLYEPREKLCFGIVKICQVNNSLTMKNLENAKKIAIECLNEFPKNLREVDLKIEKEIWPHRDFDEDIKIIDDFLELMRIENLNLHFLLETYPT